MRKLTFFAAFFMLANVVFAGGLLTNTNQSAQFIRLMSRNASLDIDAVYFNPAGLIKMEDGWHFAFYSQTILQDKNVESLFPLLNDGKYVGKVTVPVFPTAFAVYKMDNWAFSLGFGPNAGGGSATFDRGLPSFEIPISKVVPGLSGAGLPVTGYSADLAFEGSSIFWGVQLGASYKVSDAVSVYGGVRYMPSKNTYIGSIRNVQVETGGQFVPAPTFLNATSANLQALADMPKTLNPFLAAGGSYTLAQLQGAGMLDETKKSGIEAGLKLMGLPQEQINVMNLNQINGAYVQASPGFQKNSTQLAETADKLEDREVDTEQTGAGFTPMVGVNISPNDDWNIGIKYEHKTVLKLTNATKVDDLGLFKDKDESQSDVPGILGLGLGYRGVKWLEAQLSYNMYFNKGVNWGKNTRDMAVWGELVKNGLADPTKIRNREIDKNGYEVGLGLQFNLTDNFSFSVGGLYGDMGVADSYQSDFSYSNPSTTIGAGIMWKITDKITLDAGASNTFYQDQTVSFTDPNTSDYSEILGKTTLTFAAGLSFSIF